jgi:hypothetical protein
MFLSRIIAIGDPVFVIGAIDKLNFGMGFPYILGDLMNNYHKE